MAACREGGALSLGHGGSVNPRGRPILPPARAAAPRICPAASQQKVYTSAYRLPSRMTTTIQSGAGVSRYLRLYRVLSQTLAEGRIGAGQALPSEPCLMRDYGVSRSTVRRALARLEAEGRIDRQRGRGTFARGRGGPSAASRDLSAILDDAQGGPRGAAWRIIAWQRVPTPAFLCGEHPAFGAGALLLRRIRSVEREPIVLETAYIPEEIGAALTRRQLASDAGALLRSLAASGHRASILEREFAALEADPRVAGSLGIAVGSPVLNVRTLARDARQGIVAYVSCLYRADRYEAHAAIAIGRPERARAGRRG